MALERFIGDLLPKAPEGVVAQPLPQRAVNVAAVWERIDTARGTGVLIGFAAGAATTFLLSGSLPTKKSTANTAAGRHGPITSFNTISGIGFLEPSDDSRQVALLYTSVDNPSGNGWTGSRVAPGRPVRYTTMVLEDGRLTARNVKTLSKTNTSMGGLGIPAGVFVAVMGSVWLFASSQWPRKIWKLFGGSL